MGFKHDEQPIGAFQSSTNHLSFIVSLSSLQGGEQRWSSLHHFIKACVTQVIQLLFLLQTLQSDLQHPVVIKTEETASVPSNDGRIDQFFSPVHNEDNDLNLYDKSCK